MKSIIKYISFFLLLSVLLALTLPFVPAVTKVLTQKALSYYLEIDTEVTDARLNYRSFHASGTLEGNNSFELAARPSGLSALLVTLRYRGDLYAFSPLAGIEFPHIATDLNATFHTEHLRLSLSGTLLEGSVEAFGDFEKERYSYTLSDLNLTSFRLQQSYTIPPYATGLLSASGNGSFASPYAVDFAIESKALRLEENATALISSKLEHPLPLELGFNGSLSTDALHAGLRLESALIDLKSRRLDYDFDKNSFALLLELTNRQTEAVPLKSALLDLNGTLVGEDLNATFSLLADGYRLSSSTLRYKLDTDALSMDYNISSRAKTPFNLQGDYALLGDLGYGDGLLSATMDSKAVHSPVLLTLKADKLSIISNNINLSALQEMLNREVIAEGNAALFVQADLSHEPLLWNASLKSANLALPLKYRKSLGLENDLQVEITAVNNAKGDIRVVPAIESNTAIIGHSALLYIPATQKLFFNINANKLKTPHYKASRVNLKGSYDLKNETLGKTALQTPNEKIDVTDLHYSKGELKSHFSFVVSRLDRFAPLSSDYNLSAKSYLHYTPQKSTLLLSSKQLGDLELVSHKHVITASGKGLGVEELLRLTGRPVVLEGDLGYTVRYSPSSIKAAVHADRLSGQASLEPLLRPFALDLNTSLKYKGDRFRGEASLQTQNDTLRLTDLSADLSEKAVKSRYRIDVRALEQSSYILPEAFKGPLLLSGEYEKNAEQRLALDLTGFQLPAAWHRKLDKNATTPLETNSSLQAYTDGGVLNLDANVTNRLLSLRLHDSRVDTASGDFAMNALLLTDLWFQDSNITAEGSYREGRLTLAHGGLDTARETIHLHDLHYTPDDSNLSLNYAMVLKAYKDAPYRGTAEIYGHFKNRPGIDATLESNTLGGALHAEVSDERLNMTAHNVSVAKLIAFSGKELPVTQGSLDAEVSLRAAALGEGNFTDLSGSSDINITDMMIKGIDLDRYVQDLRDSQDLSLFQGSLGEMPIIRSIKSIPSDFMTRKDVPTTHIREVRLLTGIDKAMVHCEDCALSTDKNLIAMQGDININSRRFEKFYVGLLHPSNCAYFVQEIEGTLSDPKIHLARAGFNLISGAAISLIGNIGSVVDLGGDIIKGTGAAVGNVASYVPIIGDRTDRALTSVTDVPKNITSKATECTPFYTGTLKHPNLSKK